MQKLYKIIASLLLAAIVVLPTVVSPVKSFAAVDATQYQKAQVSFTFDDGFESMYVNAAPILNAAGFQATLFYITGLGDGTFQDGMTDDDKPGMTWEQVEDLKNNYGWEIGSHTVSHPLLSTLTKEQVDAELIQSRDALSAHGINATTFAFPEGDYLNPTLVETAKYYQSSRGFQDVGLETFPYNDIVITDESLDSSLTLAQAKTFVDQAIANKQWLVFTGHGIQAKADPDYEYVWTTANFQALVDYVKSKNVPVVKYGDAVKEPGINVLANSDFSNGDTSWRNDNATQVTLDTADNGAYSSTANTDAVKITGGASAAHLFSDLIDNVPGANYLLNAYYNTLGLTGGELGFYIDEYDAFGNWISGQWIDLVANNTVGFFNKLYTATSTLVSKIGVQVYLTAGSTGTAYVDNINLQNLDATASATPTPTITPTPTGTPSGTPTPTPAQDNLVQNSSFETTSGGFADFWTNDNAAWTINTAGLGNDGENSAQVTPNSASDHLFSSLIAVDNTNQYTWSTYTKTTNLSGEFGYYIDEYDNLGNWISGQWKGMINTAFDGIKTFIYVPTSNLVNSVRLQYYTTPNSTGTVNVDSVALVPSTTPTTTPSVTPSVSPTGTPSATPTPTTTVTPTPGVNLVANPSFEQADGSNWAVSWVRETTDWILDTLGLGNDGANSVKLTSTGAATHMFANTLTIDSTKSYVWSTYVKTTDLTGEFGFYIDEYDANGTWISGQWKGMLNAAFTGTKSFNYVPTSTNVKSVRLQYYLSPNSTGTVILDSDSLMSN